MLIFTAAISLYKKEGAFRLVPYLNIVSTNEEIPIPVLIKGLNQGLVKELIRLRDTFENRIYTKYAVEILLHDTDERESKYTFSKSGLLSELE
jgi:hypothetical protein